MKVLSCMLVGHTSFMGIGMNIKELKCSKCGQKGKFWERDNKLDCKLCGAENPNPSKSEVPTLRCPPREICGKAHGACDLVKGHKGDCDIPSGLPLSSNEPDYGTADLSHPYIGGRVDDQGDF